MPFRLSKGQKRQISSHLPRTKKQIFWMLSLQIHLRSEDLMNLKPINPTKKNIILIECYPLSITLLIHLKGILENTSQSLQGQSTIIITKVLQDTPC